jgi:hypothetical protein
MYYYYQTSFETVRIKTIGIKVFRKIEYYLVILPAEFHLDLFEIYFPFHLEADGKNAQNLKQIQKLCFPVPPYHW